MLEDSPGISQVQLEDRVGGGTGVGGHQGKENRGCEFLRRRKAYTTGCRHGSSFTFYRQQHRIDPETSII